MDVIVLKKELGDIHFNNAVMKIVYPSLNNIAASIKIAFKSICEHLGVRVRQDCDIVGSVESQTGVSVVSDANLPATIVKSKIAKAVELSQ